LYSRIRKAVHRAFRAKAGHSECCHRNSRLTDILNRTQLRKDKTQNGIALLLALSVSLEECFERVEVTREAAAWQTEINISYFFYLYLHS
jgi:hypothetical protein